MNETKSALPVKIAGTEITRFNALRHGVLSGYTVLPWEDAAEYRDLVASLVAEHAPHGPTEEHLVEELAGILWRKRRLRLAESAAHRHGLEDALSQSRRTSKRAVVHIDAADGSEDVAEAVRATAADTEDALRDMEEDEAMTRQALDLLNSRRNDPYEAATVALRDALARDPAELEEDEEPFTADAEGLRRFLEDEVLPWFEARKKELANRPLIREQAFGEALDPDKLERLGRYEVHLDRKLERMLAMLLRLKDLRQGSDRGLIRFAKPMALASCTRRGASLGHAAPAYAALGSRTWPSPPAKRNLAVGSGLCWSAKGESRHGSDDDQWPLCAK